MLILRSLRLICLFTIVLFLTSLSLAAAQDDLGGEACPDSDFTCITLTLPLDHFSPDDTRTVDVTFAILRASGERKGMFVTAVGGPGGSGIAVADSYAGSFDPSITEQFDIVFFDQRGIAASGGLTCVEAVAVYYQTEAFFETPEQEVASIESARKFTDDCIAEMGVAPEDLVYYGTAQAVEDLDAFREAVGDDKLWLYGESYGTQFAQTYAAAHPENVAGLILDGTVDLTLSIEDYLLEQAAAFNDVLTMTLEACNENEDCAADVAGGDALAFYDDLAAELLSSPAVVNFPLPEGGRAERPFSHTDLEVAVLGYLYSTGTRQILQRAIASASQGDLVPLMRLLYSNLYLDPQTLEPIPDPTFSDAMYYGVECNDYSYFSGTPDERAEAYMRAGDTADATIPNFSAVFYGDLPCVFWPGNPPAERPAALTAEGIPTLVLNATTDPATPSINGTRVFSQLSDGYLVTMRGGSHVLYGRGDTCIDDLVAVFLANDEVPASRKTECDGVVAEAYVPLSPAKAADFPDVLEAVNWGYNDIYYLPEYYYWDYVTPTAVGCPYGGTLRFEPNDEGHVFTFDNCAFTEGFVMTGTGVSKDEDFSVSFDLTISGDAEGDVSFLYDAEGVISIKGTYAGEDVDLSR